MGFQERLEKAIERGQRTRDAQREAENRQALNEQELQRLHSQYRLQLSERIERCLAQLVDHFPGFQLDPVVAERGWGAAISRTDLDLRDRRRRAGLYSRFEMVIRPITSYFVLELAAKATIRDKEVFNRSHYQRLADVDLTSFTELVDLWSLEYAELYAAGE